MAISTDHLRSGHRFETECPADLGLDRGIDVRVRADCTRQLADRDHLSGMTQPRAISVDLKAPERELHPERRGLGMHTVCATRHCGVSVLVGATPKHVDESGCGIDEEVGRRGERRAQRGVDDVGRREPVVDPLAGGTSDPLLHDVDERCDVVIGECFAGCDLGNERGIDHGSATSRCSGVVDGDDAER